MFYLNTLNIVLRNCEANDFLNSGGDFNCTEHVHDRNHTEPHMHIICIILLTLVMFGKVLIKIKTINMGSLIILSLWLDLIGFIHIDIT